MPRRFLAPDHAREIFAPSGPIRADKRGIVELGDDATRADLAALHAAGCKPIEAAEAPGAAPAAPQREGEAASAVDRPAAAQAPGGPAKARKAR